jgi:hypothetical protein
MHFPLPFQKKVRDLQFRIRITTASNAISEVFSAVLLKIQVFGCGFGLLDPEQQGTRIFQKGATARQMTQRHIPEHSNRIEYSNVSEDINNQC